MQHTVLNSLKEKIKNINFYYCTLAVILLVGIILRLKAYFTGYTLWLDECSLALSIIKRGVLGFFSPLEHIQSAPPLFMMPTKFITNIFGTNKFSLRLIPNVSAILALPAFYLFAKKFLEKKYSVVIALVLFSLNYQIVYYSVEFKQYSSDILICLIAFLFFERFNIKTNSLKRIFLAGLCGFLGFLFCIPSIFITGGYLLCNLKNLKGNIKNFLTFLSPFIIFMPVYYIYSLYPSRLEMVKHYGNLWQSGFITLNPLSILIILKENIQFFFNQNNFTLFATILFLTGFFMILKQIKKQKDVKGGVNSAYLLLISSLICIIIASFFEIYPLKQRVALYILPVFLVLIIKPIDFINFKSDVKHTVKSIVIILFSVFFISSYNFQYIKNIYKNIEIKKGYGDKLMQIVQKKYKNDEIIVCNDASNPIYIYNSLRQNFKTDSFILIKLTEYNKEYYQSLLNQLPKGYAYWFYYPYDYSARPVVSFIEEWAKDKNIIDVYKINSAYLLHIKL